MKRREFLASGMAATGAALGFTLPCAGAAADAGAVLYNGIRLAAPWPPRVRSLSSEPMPVPYLAAPPAVIPIDVGRQLFVDDFLIQETTLRRTFHQAEYHPASPVVRPDQPWEQTGRDP